MSVKIKICE